jgi:4-hydroxybenzoate polyprenyltransferase
LNQPASKKIFALVSRLGNAVKYILPPVFSVIYLSLSKDFTLPLLWKILLFSGATLFISVFGYFINDAADVRVDKLAGQKNMAEKIPIPLQICIAFILLVLGIVALRSVSSQLVVWTLVAAEVFFLILYSVPPLRLKNHPLLGPVLDAHYGHILPVFITLAVFFPGFFKTLDPLLLLLYFLLLFKGCRNILLHQIEDRTKDRMSQINTFPNRFGPYRTVLFIIYIVLPIEFILGSILLYIFIPWPSLIGIGFISFLIFYIFNFAAWKFPKLPVRQLKLKPLYFLNDFYEIWLPFLCIWSSGLGIFQKCILSGIHAILFFYLFKKVWKDIKKIGENLGLLKQAR